MTVGVGRGTLEKDFGWICAAEWESSTIEEIKDLFGLDYADLSQRAELSEIMTAFHEHDDLDGWTQLGVRWTARLNASDPIVMEYYDIVVLAPNGDSVQRSYQVRSEEIIP